MGRQRLTRVRVVSSASQALASDLPREAFVQAMAGLQTYVPACTEEQRSLRVATRPECFAFYYNFTSEGRV